MIDSVARLLLSPLLITQALRVRRVAQSLPEATGPRSGNLGTGQALRLRIIGDSSAAGVGVLHQQDALAGQMVQALSSKYTVEWHLDAITGATTRSTLARLKSATPRPADIVVTALGVNDVTRLIPARIWIRQQHQLFDRINQLYAPKAIYLSGMPPLGNSPLLPNPLRWTLGRHARTLENALIASLFGNTQINYMPFSIHLDPGLVAGDGFHPSAELYSIWAKEMASRINSDWPKLA